MFICWKIQSKSKKNIHNNYKWKKNVWRISNQIKLHNKYLQLLQDEKTNKNNNWKFYLLHYLIVAVSVVERLDGWLLGCWAVLVVSITSCSCVTFAIAGFRNTKWYSFFYSMEYLVELLSHTLKDCKHLIPRI